MYLIKKFLHNFNVPTPLVLRWVASRVGIIYIIIFVFCLTCVDLKMLDTRIKVRHLNDAIPDFSDLIVFVKAPEAKKNLDWKSYKEYFELIMHYVPDDVISRPLLGFIEYHTGQEQKAIVLFKSSRVMKEQPLFLSNYNLGLIYYKKGMWSEAAGHLVKAIQADPRLNMFLMQNAIVYKQIFSSNVFNFSLGEEMKEARSRAYILLLSSLYRMGLYDKMIMVAHSAQANPDLFYKDAFYYYEGLAFFAARQMDRALLLFQKSLSIEKENPEVYYYIASIYQNIGQLQKANEFLQASYALHQRNDPRFPYDKQLNLRFF